MGGFDLYGTYYADSRDALIAEEAQCARIDAEIAIQRSNRTEATLYGLCEGNHYEILQLQERVQKLEEQLSKFIPPTEANHNG